eukprot:84228-Lingulodinium_polyedra.AAC.1
MDQAMVDQLEKHFRYGAAEAIPAAEQPAKRHILPNRMLLARKSDKLMARRAVGGHLAPDAGEYK